jgi:hypothetical protein
LEGRTGLVVALAVKNREVSKIDHKQDAAFKVPVVRAN